MERFAKQVLVVRKDLKMRKGKIAAQCAHASLAVVLHAMKRKAGPTITRTLEYTVDSAMGAWLEGRFTKVCVYVESEEALDQIYEAARAADVPTVRITDSGKTEFKGVPTKTVVAVGPDWTDRVNSITGELPLL